jgi:hypothetical protein
MKTIQKIILFLLLLVPMIGAAQSQEIPFTLDDRDRIIRTEQKVDAVINEMNGRFEAVNQRFDAMDKRFDQLFNFLWAFIGIFTAMMMSVFGFAFWDRKLSLIPMKRENTRVLNALREYAEHQPKLREILKNTGLL